MILALLLTLTAGAAPQAPGAVAQPPLADPKLLFAKLEGRWSCTGAFANKKPLASDLSFTRSPDGRSLRYSHIDRAPNTYRQEATWGLDKDSGQLVSLAFTAFGEEPRPSAAMYAAETWTTDSVTLVHKKLLAEPFAPNRFTYSVADGKLRMLWEVGRSDQWRMGDYLDCERAAADGRKAPRS